MASLDVIALDPVTPQLRAPGVGDTYHFCRVVEFQDGTVTVPSITNVGDADTGIYWPADNAIAFTTAGVQRLSLGATTVFNEDGADVDLRVEGDTDANLLFVDASTDRVGLGLNNPDRLLDVDGSSKFRGQILITSGEPLTLGLQALQLPTGTESTIGAGLSTRTGVAGESIIQFGNNMNTYYTGSINAAKAGAMIRIDTRGVEPTPGASAYSVFQIQTRAAGVADPNYTVPVQIGAAPQGTFCIQTNGLATFNYGFVVNEGGGDYDTRFEGDTDTHLFFADASTDRIGIGTSSPAFKLDVAGTGKVSALYLTAMTAGSGALYYDTGPENRLTLANYNVGGTIFFETNGGAYAGAIDASQNWGIGTTTPNVRLDVNGAMRLRGSTSGYVGLQAAAVAGTTTYTLPSADGSNGQVLTTNGTGTLSWTTNAGGDVTGPASASDNAIARFDGTTGKLIQNSAVFVDDDGDVGIGTSTPGEKLQIESGTPRIYMNATTNSASAGMYFRVKDGSGNADNSGIFLEPTANIANRYINFSASNIGSDMAIVAGGNVGIGTVSPAYKLDVRGAAVGGNFVAISADNISAGSGSPPNTVSINFSSAGVTKGSITTAVFGDGYMAFATNNNTEKMRLTASGNLGLGVTPSAWNSAYTAFQSKNASFFGTTNATEAAIGANTVIAAGGSTYISNGQASIFQQINGEHRFLIAPSGTAGNAISFTQAMTLDASGNLLLGSSSTLGYRSQIFSATNGYTQALVQTSAFNSGNLAGTVYSGYYDGSNITDLASIRGGKENTTSGNFAGMLAFYTRPNGGSDTERARITSGGNLLVGGTVSRNRLTVNGLVTDTPTLGTAGGAALLCNTDSNYGMMFGTSGFGYGWIQQQRVDGTATSYDLVLQPSGGSVGIGTTSPTAKLHVWQTGAATSLNIDGIENPIFAARYAANADGATIFLAKSRNATVGSHTIVQNGDELGVLKARGSNGSAFADAASITFAVDGTPGASNDMPGRIVFGTSADGTTSITERARITSGGAFLVGTTTTGGLNNTESVGCPRGFGINRNATDFAERRNWAISTENNEVGDFGILSSTTNTGNATTLRLQVTRAGSAYNTTGTWGTISDERFKQDIVDAPSQWGDIKAIRFRKYRMKADVEADPNAPELLGVVAQELEQVCPGLVDGEKVKTVKSSILLMKAAVALQEAIARIESLEAKVAALEAK